MKNNWQFGKPGFRQGKYPVLKLFIGLVLCIFACVYPSAGQKISAEEVNGFNIDEGQLYPDMETTYQEGYVPKISDGKAVIVVPLVHCGTEYVDNGITASIDYGGISGTPFVIRQYQKKVEPQSFTFEEEKKEVYLTEFVLDLKDDRMNGTYPVTVKIQYNAYIMTQDGYTYTRKAQEFPIYVTITDGRDPDSDTGASGSDVNIRMESCTLEPARIYPGDTFTIHTGIKNTSTEKEIRNIKVSYDNAAGALIPANHTGTVYLDGIAAGASKQLTMEMKAADNVTDYNQRVTMTVTYEDQDGKAYSETENIYITLLPASGQSAEDKPPNYLELDTTHIFSGMDHSYAQGYQPAVTGGKAVIVLPLLLQGEGSINNDEITASIGLTDGSSQAFIMKNYEKEFKLSRNTTSQGEKVSAYLVSFSLELKKDRTNGVYPVSVNIKYQSGTEVKEQSFSLYIEITDGKAPADAQQEPQTVFPPKLMIEACTVNPAQCQAGDVVTFHITLKNTSNSSSIRDLELIYSSDSGDLVPADYNNSIYIDRIGKDSIKELTFRMKASGEPSSSNQKINLSMAGTDDNAVPVTAAENLYLSIKLPVGIVVDKPDIKTEVESGKTETVKVPVFNTGRTKLKNVMCTLKLPGVIPSQTAFIGDIEPGASAEGSIDAVIANKKTTDPTVNEEDKYGLTEGTVTVSYEDEDGNALQKTVKIMTKIIPPADQPEEAEGISQQWWISIIIGLIAIELIVTGILTYRRKNRI